MGDTPGLLDQWRSNVNHTINTTLQRTESHHEESNAALRGEPAPPVNPARKVQQVGGMVLGAIQLPVDIINTSIATFTQGIAAHFSPMPAASMTSLYMAPPHGHLHPPSFTPPATPAPVPLPSFGPVLIGTDVKTHVGGLPAARAGDIGVAMTCCGFIPMFEIFMGSSNTLIGGMRAGRQLDISRACVPAIAGAVRGVAAAMAVAGQAVALAGVVADGLEAGGSDAMSSAMGLSAAMGAASMANDAIALAATAAMGKDIASPPWPGVVARGASNVMIGGFPLPNIPNPALALLNKLSRMRQRRRNPAPTPEDSGMPGNRRCPR